MPGEGVHLMTRMYALAECGRLEEATALAATVYEATPVTAPPDALMWLAHARGRCALMRGQPATARRWFAEARVRSEENHHAGPRRIILSALATAAAVLADADGAAAAVEELEQIPPLAFQRPEQEFGPAWARVVEGDLSGARRVLRAAADLAASTGYRTSEAALLHDVARLGEPASVVDRLAELATDCEGELVGTYAAHAVAVARHQADALADTADRFVELGAVLLAAEAAAEAAQAYQRAGDRRAAAALGVRSAGLAATCEGARTPALTVPVTVVPLTGRERDIATLAARGEPSKAIAERLFLSVRTVDNHLQNVYSKLGIGSRRELAAALADLDAGGE